ANTFIAFIISSLGISGNLYSSVSNVDILKDIAPASIIGLRSEVPPLFFIVPHKPISTKASFSNSADFSLKISALFIGLGKSYGISKNVVTPPLAANLVVFSNPYLLLLKYF